MLKKIIALLCITIGLGFFAGKIGLNAQQAMAISIFSASVLGTLLFWDFRLAFVFLGVSVLLITGTIDLEHLVRYASLEVILFLVGMMILVGLLKESGFFQWVTKSLLAVKDMTAAKFVITLVVTSAVFSATVDEVTSIIFMVTAILAVCDHLDTDPVPFLIISVLATNIGSAATVLGNPIGILIATKAGLTFEDFIAKALPLAVICIAVLMPIVMFWYRKAIAGMDVNIKKFRAAGKLDHEKAPLSKELKISMIIFGVTLIFISLHYRLELLFKLTPNTILLIMPLIASGCVMIWKHDKARLYVERDVEWWTLIFFLLLFAQAGTLKYTGTTDVLANRLVGIASDNTNLLTGLILWIAAIGSSILDNVVLVATLIPVIQSFKEVGINTHPLWWALLFGGCLGGNITLVGSTANIVALGILEKKKNIKMTFLRWFGIGLTVGVVTTIIVWVALLVLPFYHN